MRWIVLFAAFGILFAAQVVNAGGHMVVVTNVKNKQKLDKDTIRAIYNDNILTWKNGQSIVVYHLPKNSAKQKAFSKKVLGVSADVMLRRWIQRENDNLPRNEKHESSENRIFRLIAENPNAIGYLPRTKIRKKSGLRIVYGFRY